MSVADQVVAVVVDFHTGTLLGDCVDSLHHEHVRDVVVVNNGTPGSSAEALHDRPVVLVEPGVNLGYGRGVNRGIAAAPKSEYLVVSNADVMVHPGALEQLVTYLDQHRDVGIVGPRIEASDGSTYPSVRQFPDPLVALAHSILGPMWPSNPWSRRYRSPDSDGHVDWVSGAFFVIRYELMERLGGFDERYFMFAEDMDLCWRAGRAGARIATCPDAVVTHVEGVSRQRAPRAMIVAHHQNALRFEAISSQGWRRLLLPLAALALGCRLSVVVIAHSLKSFATRSAPSR